MVEVTFLLNNLFYKNKVECVIAEDANDAIEQFCIKIQDLNCLLRQIPMMGTEKDQKEGKKLADFMGKYYAGELTNDSLLEFSFELSTGSSV